MTQPDYGTPDTAGPGRLPSSEPSFAAESVESQLRAAAIRSLRRKQGFKVHLLVYLLVNALLIAIWVAGAVASGQWFPWWIFPFFGWGIGVAIDGWTAYRGNGITENAIRAEMDRIARR